MDGIARPQFFEGQYIGADDLDTIVTYTRKRHAQHLLAGHGWGIAAGLELIEQPNPDGSVSVWLQPGYAWDGYGRPIVVGTPTPLDATQLQGKPSGAWLIWLGYAETQQDAARASYGVCTGTDTFLRIAEGFQVVISGQLPLDQQQSGVMESGTLRPDARLVRRLSDPNGPFLCDANVPEQGENPLGGKAVWLVPVGLIGWTNATQQVRPLTDDEKKGARLLRRNAAAIAEEILAPGGLLRLRPHGILPAPGTADSAVGAICAASRPLATDLVLTAGGRVTFDDLVWVEGNLRVLGNARLYGGQIDVRMRDGSEPGGSLFLRRNLLATTNQDLEVSIGQPPSGTGPANRLVVGASQNGTLSAPPALAVLADRRVGIGVGVPGTGLALDINGDFGHDAGPTALHLNNSRIGDAGAGVLLLTSNGGTIALGDDGSVTHVAIGTKSPQPDTALDVRGGGIAVNNNNAFLRLLGSALIDQSDGILRIRSGGSTVTFDGNDNVGIGTVNPSALLDVNGDMHVAGTLNAGNMAAANVSGNINANGNVSASGNVEAGVDIGAGRDLGVGRNATIFGNGLVKGNLTVNGVFANLSDLSLKRDVQPLGNALGRLLALRGVEFEWAREDLARLRPGRHSGLIADEVETVFPDWVHTEPESGMKLLSPQGFEGLVVEALREVVQRLDALEVENRTLRQQAAESRRRKPKVPG